MLEIFETFETFEFLEFEDWTELEEFEARSLGVKPDDKGEFPCVRHFAVTSSFLCISRRASEM